MKSQNSPSFDMAQKLLKKKNFLEIAKSLKYSLKKVKFFRFLKITFTPHKLERFEWYASP